MGFDLAVRGAVFVVADVFEAIARHVLNGEAVGEAFDAGAFVASVHSAVYAEGELTLAFRAGLHRGEICAPGMGRK